MKNKVDSVLLRGAFAFAILFVSLCGAAFADDPAQPCVRIGVVAQRYPWNGTLDIGYKASDLPAVGTNAVVTVTAGGKTYTQDVTITNGQNSVAFANLPANVKAKDAKVTLKLR